jgi:hypothetical protein
MAEGQRTDAFDLEFLLILLVADLLLRTAVVAAVQNVADFEELTGGSLVPSYTPGEVGRHCSGSAQR